MSADTPDYKDTINLPVTDFPMRAGLPGREPIWLDRWAKIGVYEKLREKKGRENFNLFFGVLSINSKSIDLILLFFKKNFLVCDEVNNFGLIPRVRFLNKLQFKIF